jgi:hypothetical protein
MFFKSFLSLPLSEFILLFFVNINFFTVDGSIKPEHVCQLPNMEEILTIVATDLAMTRVCHDPSRMAVGIYNPTYNIEDSFDS